MDSHNGGNEKERGESPRRAKKRRNRDDSQGSMGDPLILGILPKRRKYDPRVITQNRNGKKLRAPLFTVIHQYDVKSQIRGPFYDDHHRVC